MSPTEIMNKVSQDIEDAVTQTGTSPDGIPILRLFPHFDPAVMLFNNKQCWGGTQASSVCNLPSMLLVKCPADTHFVQYNCSRNPVRINKGTKTDGMSFGIAAYDIDWDHHKTKPSEIDFANLVHHISTLNMPIPSIIYETRGGARLIYGICPVIDNPTAFERHYLGLWHRINEPLKVINDGGGVGLKYDLDPNTKDWGRLFRCPRVERADADGVVIEEFDRHSRVYHKNKLDITQYEGPAPRKKRAIIPIPVGLQKHYLAQAYKYVKDAPPAISGESGHTQTFKVACALINKFQCNEEWVWKLMLLYNERCDPQWSDKELEHKITSAVKCCCER